MRIPSPTRLVFLDTEVFIKVNFNYQSTSFKKLIELVEEKEVELYLTTITRQEILDNLAQEAKKAKSAFKQLHKEFRKKAKILDNLAELAQVLSFSFDEEKIDGELEQQFLNFLDEAKVNILSLEKVSSEEIFDKYFQKSPPFSEKKKYEFPDAFTIAVIEKKAEIEKKQIYVVSSDSDWASTCQENENLIWLDSLDKLLEKIIIETSKKLDLCYEYLENNLKAIEQKIADQFLEIEVVLSDAYEFVEFGSEDIEIEVHSVKIIDKSLVNVDKPFIIFELRAEISFSANISYDSLEMAVWDKEDERYYNVETVEDRVDQTITLPVEVELSFSIDNLGNISIDEIENVTLNSHQSIDTIEIKPDWYEDYY
jgi:predicted nucleic acid-binding protein